MALRAVVRYDGPMAWLAKHWLDLVQTTGIIGGLFFTGWSARREGRAQKASSLLKLTEQHRDLWRELFSNPSLSRVLNPDADTSSEGLSEQETLFVTLLILHLNTAYSAIRAGVLDEPEGLTPDIAGFFSLPIPLAGWMAIRHLHDPGFVDFVEARRAR